MSRRPAANSRAIAQGNKENVSYATQPDELEGISKTLFEILDIARDSATPMLDFDSFLTENVFIPLDEHIQDHLEMDARDRISGTIKQRKGGVRKEMLPFVQATERDIQNFSDAYKLVLNSKVLPSIYNTTMERSRDLIREQNELLLRSLEQKQEIENKWAAQDLNPSFHDLLELHLQLEKMRREYANKEKVVEAANMRLKLTHELTAYLRDILIPLNQLPQSFSFDSYTPPTSLYKAHGNKTIAALDKQITPIFEAWEKENSEEYVVHGRRFLDTMKENTWAAVDPSEFAKAPKVSAARNRATSSNNPMAGPLASGRRSSDTSPMKSPGRRRGSGAGGLRPAASPVRGTSTSVGAVPQLTPTKTVADATGVDVPRILLHRDIPYKRPEKDADLFDPQNTDGGKRAYLIEQQEDTGADQYIKVTARIRPFQPHESSRGDRYVVSVSNDGTCVELDRAAKNKSTTSFKMTASCSPETSQLEFYNKCNVRPLLDRALQGNYVTAFAYGQTGSGKTHSIAGPEEVIMLHEGIRISDPNGQLPESVKSVLGDVLQSQLLQHGIMPRSARYMFDKIVEAELNDENLQYEVRCSYVEIYNESLMDLLNPTNINLDTKLNTGEREGFRVEGLTERIARSTDDVMSIFMEGAKNRKTSSHLLNVESSRSHALFVMTIDKKTYDPEEHTLWTRRGKVTFVDLAGSESVKTTQTSGSGLRETAGINTSLLNLSNIVANIAKNGLSQSAHVPWRNSKLTMLLMESLANNGSTIMIACVSPSNEYLSETSNTLTFATKASNIVRFDVKKVTAGEKETDALRSDVIRIKQKCDKLEAENTRLKQLLTDAGIEF